MSVSAKFRPDPYLSVKVEESTRWLQQEVGLPVMTSKIKRKLNHHCDFTLELCILRIYNSNNTLWRHLHHVAISREGCQHIQHFHNINLQNQSQHIPLFWNFVRCYTKFWLPSENRIIWYDMTYPSRERARQKRKLGYILMSSKAK